MLGGSSIVEGLGSCTANDASSQDKEDQGDERDEEQNEREERKQRWKTWRDILVPNVGRESQGLIRSKGRTDNDELRLS